MIEKPIFVIGAARSGTTLIAELILSQHPCIFYLSEPNYIWRFGNAYKKHDVLIDKDLNNIIKKYIRNKFFRLLKNSNKRRLLEKTPANCLRIPFICSIFPDAKFLHIIRDGRDVVYSASIQWLGGLSPKRSSQLNKNEINYKKLFNILKHFISLVKNNILFFDILDFFRIIEIPAYLPRVYNYFIKRVIPGKPEIWGPRFPGIEEYFKTLSLYEVCAIQWDMSVRFALKFGRELPKNQYLEIKYEEFLKNPDDFLKKILEFLELEYDKNVFERLKIVKRNNFNKWKRIFNEYELKKIMFWIEPTLKFLEYE